MKNKERWDGKQSDCGKRKECQDENRDYRELYSLRLVWNTVAVLFNRHANLPSITD